MNGEESDEMDDDDVQGMKPSKLVRAGLFVVAMVSVACAVLNVFFPRRLDEKTAMFLGVAVVALVIHQITKFKGFGIEFEKDVKRLKKDMRSVETAFGQLEKDVGPGSKSAVAAVVAPAAAQVGPESTAHTIEVNPEDPNKGQFGGLSERNGRKLSAKIRPIAGPKNSQCEVKIRVDSTDPSRPLTGKVRLYLHPTFGQWSSYDIDAKGGIAEEKITSYGAFTIGAAADEGKTPLELDLVNVPGGTQRFYQE